MSTGERERKRYGLQGICGLSILQCTTGVCTGYAEFLTGRRRYKRTFQKVALFPTHRFVPKRGKTTQLTRISNKKIHAMGKGLFHRKNERKRSSLPRVGFFFAFLSFFFMCFSLSFCYSDDHC